MYLQAMHKICLAHFERDQAAGGNMYVKFARCYLELAGKDCSQLKAKEPLHAPATDTGQFQASCITLLSQTVIGQKALSAYRLECPHACMCP